MAEYINEQPCEFIYNITAVEKIVDGDTIDAVFDLGCDVRICNRSRTRNRHTRIQNKAQERKNLW